MRVVSSIRCWARLSVVCLTASLVTMSAGCTHPPIRQGAAASSDVVGAEATAGPPTRVVHRYFQALERGEFDGALAFWRADAAPRPTRTRLQQTYAGLARLRSSIIGQPRYDTRGDTPQASVDFRIIEYRMLAQQPQTYSGTCTLIARAPTDSRTNRYWQIERIEWNGTGPRILRSL